MLVKTNLINEDEIVLQPVVFGSGCVSAPLLKPLHFLREVEFLASLGFNDPDFSIYGPNDEIGRVIGEISVALHVVELKSDGEIVLGKGSYVRCVFEKRGER